MTRNYEVHPLFPVSQLCKKTLQGETYRNSTVSSVARLLVSPGQATNYKGDFLGFDIGNTISQVDLTPTRLDHQTGPRRGRMCSAGEDRGVRKMPQDSTRRTSIQFGFAPCSVAEDDGPNKFLRDYSWRVLCLIEHTTGFLSSSCLSQSLDASRGLQGQIASRTCTFRAVYHKGVPHHISLMIYSREFSSLHVLLHHTDDTRPPNKRTKQTFGRIDMAGWEPPSNSQDSP